jgi:hypothetical protein
MWVNMKLFKGVLRRVGVFLKWKWWSLSCNFIDHYICFYTSTHKPIQHPWYSNTLIL